MRIGINASFFAAGRGGGIERAVRMLVDSLGRIAPFDSFTLFSGAKNAGSFRLPENFAERPLPVNPENRFLKIAAEQALLPFWAAREKIEALISPGNFAALFFAPPQALIIHDCVPWEKSAGYGAFHKFALKAMFLLSAGKAAKIVVPSRFSASEAKSRLGAGPSKIIVAAESGGHIPGRVLREKENGGFILAVLSEAGQKNADGLLSAYRLARLDFGLKIPLVLVGLEKRPGNPGVVFRKKVAEKTLHALYAAAALVVVPSFYEGFGLVAAEAMAAGSPLAAARIPALLETAGSAAVYFNPCDARGTARAMIEILRDPALAARLSRDGQARAVRSTWDDFAGAVLNAAKSCVKMPS